MKLISLNHSFIYIIARVQYKISYGWASVNLLGSLYIFNIIFISVIGKRWHDYIILHSDYERFAIVWSCTVAPQGPIGKLYNYFFFDNVVQCSTIIEFAWVLTRNKNTPKDLEDMLPMYLKQGPIDIDKLIKTDQDCEPDSSGSEEFNEDQSYDCEPNQVILEFIRLILRFFN